MVMLFIFWSKFLFVIWIGSYVVCGRVECLGFVICVCENGSGIYFGKELDY